MLLSDDVCTHVYSMYALTGAIDAIMTNIENVHYTDARLEAEVRYENENVRVQYDAFAKDIGFLKDTVCSNWLARGWTDTNVSIIKDARSRFLPPSDRWKTICWTVPMIREGSPIFYRERGCHRGQSRSGRRHAHGHACTKEERTRHADLVRPAGET